MTDAAVTELTDEQRLEERSRLLDELFAGPFVGTPAEQVRKAGIYQALRRTRLEHSSGRQASALRAKFSLEIDGDFEPGRCPLCDQARDDEAASFV